MSLDIPFYRTKRSLARNPFGEPNNLHYGIPRPFGNGGRKYWRKWPILREIGPLSACRAGSPASLHRFLHRAFWPFSRHVSESLSPGARLVNAARQTLGAAVLGRPSACARFGSLPVGSPEGLTGTRRCGFYIMKPRPCGWVKLPILGNTVARSVLDSPYHSASVAAYSSTDEVGIHLPLGVAPLSAS